MLSLDAHLPIQSHYRHEEPTKAANHRSDTCSKKYLASVLFPEARLATSRSHGWFGLVFVGRLGGLNSVSRFCAESFESVRSPGRAIQAPNLVLDVVPLCLRAFCAA